MDNNPDKSMKEDAKNFKVKENQNISDVETGKKIK